MGLNSSLAIASSGLSALQSEMAVASQNVSNASTVGYVAERSSVSSRTAGGQGGGVIVGLTTRAVNTALENSLYTQNAVVGSLTTINDGLSTISALQGSTSADPGSSNTLADNVGNLQTSLTTLDGDPTNSAAQQAVVSAAGNLASGLRSTAAAYQTARQASQEAIVDQVSTVNQDLGQIGKLSKQIGQLRVMGQSTADLENQRAAAMSSLSSVLSVRFQETSTGDMLVSTADGTNLPTHQTDGPLFTADAMLDATKAYPGSIPAITLHVDGTPSSTPDRDVTTSLSGGTLGGNIQLRDQILPTMQAELDSFSQTLASRFDAQGLTLFSNSDGTVPGTSTTATAPAGQLGFAATIQVNPAVAANASTVRDGTHDVAGSATGASAFTVNTTRGSSDTTLLNRLLTFSLGTVVQPGVSQVASATTGLGANGTLSAPYSGSGSLTTLAATLTSAQGATIGDTTSALSDGTALQTAMTSKIASVSGVSVDDQMAAIVALQNAYSANAKVITAVQSMFTSLLTAIS